MRIKKSTLTEFYLGIIIMIAVSGTLLFFPMNIGGRYTCFYHRLFDPPQTEMGYHSSAENQDNKSNEYTNHVYEDENSVLLESYLHRYAFIWWGSVGILSLSIFLYVKKKKSGAKRSR